MSIGLLFVFWLVCLFVVAFVFAAASAAAARAAATTAAAAAVAAAAPTAAALAVGWQQSLVFKVGACSRCFVDCFLNFIRLLSFFFIYSGCDAVQAVSCCFPSSRARAAAAAAAAAAAHARNNEGFL